MEGEKKESKPFEDIISTAPTDGAKEIPLGNGIYFTDFRKLNSKAV
jgi:hypothetical protein